jgi:hypothetical protein
MFKVAVGVYRRQHRVDAAVLINYLLSRSKDRKPTWPVFGLLVGVSLIMAPTLGAAFDPTLADLNPEPSEGCCDMDRDYTFRGYTAELWDEAPTISEVDCPDQDDACLLDEADRISRLYRLQKTLEMRAAFWHAEHFSKGPVLVESFSID